MISLSILRIDPHAKSLLLILSIIPRVMLTPLLQACPSKGNTREDTPERNPMPLEPHEDDVVPEEAIKNRGLTELDLKKTLVSLTWLPGNNRDIKQEKAQQYIRYPHR